ADRRLLSALRRADHGHRDERARHAEGALPLARGVGRGDQTVARARGSGDRLYLVPDVYDDRVALSLRARAAGGVSIGAGAVYVGRKQRAALAADAAR